MRNRQAALIFILVTVTLDILAMGLIIPVLPKLILDFLGGKMTDAANWNGWLLAEEERLSGEKPGETATRPARETIRRIFGV